MPRFELFAARDGDTFTDISIQPDFDTAEIWAKGRIIEAFDLGHLKDLDYDEIVADIDGVNLDILPPDPIGTFLIDWLTTQAQLIEPLRKHFDGKFAKEFRSYRGGILDLILAIQNEQEGTKT